jgi:hypothetical protein
LPERWQEQNVVQILQPVDEYIAHLPRGPRRDTRSLRHKVRANAARYYTELMIESLPRATKHIKKSYLVEKTHATYDLNLEDWDSNP